MFEYTVVSDVPSSRIDIVIDMVDTEPVVNPTASYRVAHLGAERVVHDRRQHRIDFVPGIVIGEKMRTHGFLDVGFYSAKRYFAGLESLQQI
jgi:hypothetical protein